MYNPPNREDASKVLAIDFDGVIHNDNKGWHDGTVYGDIMPGAKESLKDLASRYKLIIFTAKAKDDRPLVNGKTGKELVIEWLLKHDLLQYISEVTAEKPRAKIYIDDNAYRFTNWRDTITFIEANASK